MVGDFNMKSEEWFDSTDRKAALPSEFTTANRLVVMNDSTNPTCFHQEFGFHIDVTFTSESLARQIKCWVVLEESGTGHNYIHSNVESWTMVVASKKAGIWVINKLEPDWLRAVILASEWEKNLFPTGISAEAVTYKLVSRVNAACDATMPRQRSQRKTSDAYWWMGRTAHLKLRANQLCQQYQRTHSKEGVRSKADEY